MLRKTALTLALAGALAAPAFADTITFKNGHEVHGRLVEETDKYVIFQVGNGKLKFDKREIATFTEDADYGQRYFTPPKRAVEADNVTPGVDGKQGKTFTIPQDATPEERKDLKGVHARIEEELAKIGPSAADRLRKLDLSSTERAVLDAAIASLGKGKSAGADLSSLGLKCLQALADSIQGGNSAARADAASAIVDALSRGDAADAKWALGRFKVAGSLTNALETSGDDQASQARNAANRALEVIADASMGWIETKESAPSESQRASIAKWRDWVRTSEAAFDKSEKEREDRRKQIDSDWRDLEDSRNWRKALARTVETYGTVISAGKKEDGGAKTEGGDKLNPDIAAAASPEEQKKLAEAKQKIKKCLETTVGLSVEDKKKKYAPSSEELQEMKVALDTLQEGPGRRGRGEKRENAIATVVKYGLKAIQPLADLLESGGNVTAQWDAARAIAQVAGSGDKDDAQTLFRAAGVASKLIPLLDDASDQTTSPAIRMDANKALEAISGISVSYPSGVTSQSPGQEEQDARNVWAGWASKDAADFLRVERLREEHRKALTELLKKLDGTKTWADALKNYPTAIAKAEKDLKKS